MNDHTTPPMAGDLAALMKLANAHLPPIIDEFSQVSTLLDGASINTPSAALNYRFENLRDEIQYAAAQAAQNLIETQTALLLARDGFAEADDTTASQLDAVLDDESALTPDHHEPPSDQATPDFPDDIPAYEPED